MTINCRTKECLPPNQVSWSLQRVQFLKAQLVFFAYSLCRFTLFFFFCLPTPCPIYFCGHHRPSTKFIYLPSFPTFIGFLYLPYGIFLNFSPYSLSLSLPQPWPWLAISLESIKSIYTTFRFSVLAPLGIIVAMPIVVTDMILS